MCGYSHRHGNKIGQVIYDRFFATTDGLEPQTGAITAPTEGLYLLSFYTHIDTGVAKLQTMRDKNSYYSVYIRYITEYVVLILLILLFQDKMGGT